MVAVLALVGLAVVVLAVSAGIDAVRAGDAGTAAEQTLVALVAVSVPVVVIAVYAHWLDVTTRPGDARKPPPPTLARKALIGILVALLTLAGWLLVPALFDQVLSAWDDRTVTSGILFGLAILTYLAFTFFCLARYLRWVTERRS